MKRSTLLNAIALIIAVLIIAWANYSFKLNKSEDIKNEETEALENKIKELEEKLKASESTTTNSINQTTPQEKPKVAVVPPPTTKTQAAKQVVVQQNTVATVAPVITPTAAETVGLTINRSSLMQSIFNGYGAYEIRLKVSAKGDTFYIPMTTTDSTKNMTGMSYKINGGEFRGKQSSKVSCPSVKTNLPISGNSYCVIPKGTSLDVIVTVWLTPYSSGNYSVEFKKLSYFRDNDYTLQSNILNKETEILYLE